MYDFFMVNQGHSSILRGIDFLLSALQQTSLLSKIRPQIAPGRAVIDAKVIEVPIETQNVTGELQRTQQRKPKRSRVCGQDSKRVGVGLSSVLGKIMGCF